MPQRNKVMQNKTPKIKVKFLIEKDSKEDVFAYFPYEIWDKQGNKTCYAHVGQHSACSPDYANECKIAPKNLFQPLLNELISIGYNLQVIE